MSGEHYIHFETVGQDCLWITPLDSNIDFRQPEALPELKELDHKITREGFTRVVVDLSALPHFGSIVLEWLVALWKHVRSLNGNLVIFHPTEIGREVLHVVQFDRIWPILETREDALQAVRQTVSDSEASSG